MAVLLGLAVPVVALLACLLSPATPWYAWVLLGLYLLLTLVSTTVQRIGRAGYVPCRPGPPVVVGGGWSWVLRHDRVWPPNRMLVRSGRIGSGDWWHAGTTIREVQRTLEREGRTLASHPSILSATLGGWIASQSHGTGGSLWTTALGELEVEEPGCTAPRVLESKAAYVEGAIIRKVRVHTVPNVVCERRAMDVESPEDAADLFRASTHLRAVFVDRHRSLAFLWVPCESDRVTRERSFVAPWLAILLPAWMRRRMRFPSRRMTLAVANRFAPFDPPLLLATPAIATRINFEVFCARRTSPDLLWRILRETRALFASGAVRGRMELRFGSSKQFLDFDLFRRGEGYGAVFACLRRAYGPGAEFSLHPGKAQVEIVR